MGGYGSGRGSKGGRPTTTQRLALSVDEFRRQGLDLGRVEPERGARLELSFPLSGRAHAYTWRPCDPRELPDGPPAAARAVHVQHNDEGPALVVPLSWHPVGYGWRPAFRCPECSRRARVLYAARVQVLDIAPRWTCRTCAGLAYESTRVADLQRLERRARKAGAFVGLPELPTPYGPRELPPRPAGMHHRTYIRRLWAFTEALGAATIARDAAFPIWPASLIGAGTVRRARASRAALLCEAREVYGRRIGR